MNKLILFINTSVESKDTVLELIKDILQECEILKCKQEYDLCIKGSFTGNVYDIMEKIRKIKHIIFLQASTVPPDAPKGNHYRYTKLSQFWVDNIENAPEHTS